MSSRDEETSTIRTNYQASSADDIPDADAASSRTLKSKFSYQSIDYESSEQRRDLQSPESPLFAPLRIAFDTRLLEAGVGVSNDSVEIRHVIDNVLPDAASAWSRHLSVRSAPYGIKVAPDACVAAPVVGQQVVTYSDADLVIIINNEDDEECASGETLATARPCQLDQYDRPIVGYMSLCLSNILPVGMSSMSKRTGVRPSSARFPFPELANLNAATSNNLKLADYYASYTGATFRPDHMDVSLLDTAIHELGHVLGQISGLFPYFRDENGAPRTPRNENGLPITSRRQCGNGNMESGVFPSENTVQVIESSEQRFEQYIVTPRVQSVARNHFNCNSLIGARLEDASDLCFGSHWNERHYYGNLMSPIISDSSENSLSVLTLALLEDSGWYHVDYRNASQPAFGLGAGCEFVKEDCVDRETGLLPDWVENEFCTSQTVLEEDGSIATESLNHVFCDPSYESWAVCDLFELRAGYSPSPPYFPSNPQLGPISLRAADGCPVPTIGLGLDCRKSDSYNVFYPGERVGPTSRCINAFYDRPDGTGSYQPACMELTCDPSAGVVRVGSEDSMDLVCQYDGEKLAVPGRDNAFFVCPRLAAICPEMYACPSGCSGRGECVHSHAAFPTCQCYDSSNTDAACSSPYTHPAVSFGPLTRAPASAPTMSFGAVPPPSPVALPFGSTLPPAIPFGSFPFGTVSSLTTPPVVGKKEAVSFGDMIAYSRSDGVPFDAVRSNEPTAAPAGPTEPTVDFWGNLLNASTSGSAPMMQGSFLPVVSFCFWLLVLSWVRR